MWGGVEVFHTPLGRGTWEQGVQDVQPQSCFPWQQKRMVGRWVCGENGIVSRQRQKQGMRVRVDVGRDDLLAALAKHDMMKSYRFEMDLMLRSVCDVRKVSLSSVGLESPCGNYTYYFPPEVLTIMGNQFEPGLRVRVVPSESKLVAAFDEIAEDYPEDAIGRGRYHPGMCEMLGCVCTVVDVLESGLVGLYSPKGHSVWLFPPGVLEIVLPELEPSEREPTPSEVSTVAETPVPESEEEEEEEELVPAESDEEPAQEDVPVVEDPPPPLPMTVCMQVPSETLRERVERAMKFNIGHLVDAGVELPGNIQLVGNCKEQQHGGCFVYRFGTRRLHVTTQAVDDGRLLLVVRCGGGFADFAEFARRHARSENAKLQSKLATSAYAGCGPLRLGSAFSKGGFGVGNGSRSRLSSPAASGSRSRLSSPAAIGSRSRPSSPAAIGRLRPLAANATR